MIQWFAIPFAWTNSAVSSIVDTSRDVNNTWIGSWPEGKQIWPYLDTMIMMLFGGIPWQVYFQRVLSQKTPRRAQILSFVAGLGCFLMAVPAVLIGAIAKSTGASTISLLNATDYRYHGEVPIPEENYKLMLPLVLQYLTPLPVAIIGLGAVSVAVMSSVDSSMLSASSMFARHVYLPVRNACSVRNEGETLPRRRFFFFVRHRRRCNGHVLHCCPLDLRPLCDGPDFVFVILFPQLFCVFYVPMSNSYGSLFGFLWSLRPADRRRASLLPALIKYPIAFKSLVMLVSFGSIVFTSYVAQIMFRADGCHHAPMSSRFYVGGDDSKDKKTETLGNGERNLAYSEDGDRCTRM
ncbi:High-affinity choline transporter 1 [Lamellibrachia satsuma]|nr:High-affinity choline transporter 1 [Lamellibrachia satsuma]